MAAPIPPVPRPRPIARMATDREVAEQLLTAARERRLLARKSIGRVRLAHSAAARTYESWMGLHRPEQGN